MKKEVMKMNFEILKICAGWFDIAFITHNQKVEISASDAYGNDSPKFFIRTLAECLQSNTYLGCIEFDDEPGTYVVLFEKGEECYLKIYYSNFESASLGNVEPIYGNEAYNCFIDKINIYEELLNTRINLNFFARCVLRSFDEYKVENIALT